MLPRALLAAVLIVTAAWARQPVRSRHAMVVAEEPLAADVGIQVLKAGGNAIDAAVAVGFALAVTYPVAGNIGGGGFLLARFADGTATFIDFRERAPIASSRDMYLDANGDVSADSTVGWKAAGVPGTVRGLELAHKKYGRKPWDTLLKPAIELAQNGFEMPYGLVDSLQSSVRLPKFAESKRLFLTKMEPGERLLQPELARTLTRIAKNGADEFYEGQVAQEIASQMTVNGGLITREDLAAYKAVERTPLSGSYKGYDIITAPPPSATGIGLLQMLGVLEGSGYEKAGWGAASTMHFFTETMRRAFADRNEYLGDPDFTRNPVRSLLDKEYIEKLRLSINPDRASSSAGLKPGLGPRNESSETTQVSIVDDAGNAVSMTYTLNGSYGSGAAVPGLGFLLNNEMDDFAAKPGTPNFFGLVQSSSNAIQPGKRPLSSMGPTIVLKNGKLFLVLGGPGGARISTAILQSFLNITDFDMNVQDAVDAPRFHHQWLPDVITMERGFSPDTIKLLEARGHKLELSSSVARIFAVRLRDGWLEGAADGRSYGKAVGY